jgi:hypothetical protein
MLPAILAGIAALFELVPRAARAVQSIARAARSGPPVRPIPFGREHFWDRLARPVVCTYCGVLIDATNEHQQCPGPPRAVKP